MKRQQTEKEDKARAAKLPLKKELIPITITCFKM
jgi:hypothetical protein